MISIIDIGIGNIGSIVNMCKYIGVETEVINQSLQIKKAQKLILPGVGNFDAGMDNMIRLGIKNTLDDVILIKKTPILGICLGMQMLCDISNEGNKRGLGYIKGKCIHLSDNEVMKERVPHMGWNNIEVVSESPLFTDLYNKNKFYFTHSYHLVCDNESNVIGKTSYGVKFTSAVNQQNIFGVQFHPEKSHSYGMRLLNNFCNL
tara:strand:+ start:599 stop:1210 length:612 start_codon:yes stop_codon:yes gene_type:complete